MKKIKINFKRILGAEENTEKIDKECAEMEIIFSFT